MLATRIVETPLPARIAGMAAACVFGMAVGASGIEVSVATDSPAYVVGDPLLYTVTATNPSSAPVTLTWPSTYQANFVVDGQYTLQGFGFAVITERVIPAGGSVDWDFLHSWSQYTLTPGDHSVIGQVVNHGFSDQAALFSVAAPDPVTDDVFLDFESYPNGVATSGGGGLTYGYWEEAFVRQGVRFSSEGGSVNLKSHPDQGVVLHTPTTSYPPGFNIVAEFDMPVYGVSAEVGTASDHSVTMYGYGASGQLLGSVTSEPISSYPTFGETLTFSSETPIASLQWFSSEERAGVLIDNLALNVDDAELRGDFNGDGAADAADYSLWRDNLDRVVAPGWGPDANQDGLIDTGDLAVWRSHYGELGAGLAATVPEPIGLGLLAIGGLLLPAKSRLG